VLFRTLRWHPSVALLITIFLVVTLGMAGVYNLLWYARPDYFRIQSGLNVRPLDLEEGLRRLPEQGNGTSQLPDLMDDEAVLESLQNIGKNYSALRKAIMSLSRDSQHLSEEDALSREAYKDFEKSEFRQFDDYVSSQTCELQKRSDAIHTQATALLRSAGVSTEDDLPAYLGVRYAQLMVQFHQSEADRLRKEVEARGFGLSHLTMFQDREDQKSFLELQKKVDGLYRKVDEDQAESAKAFAAVRDSLDTYRNANRRRLNYVDFVYFSVGAATTATFGDIAPNASLVRGLVCIQVFFSIGATGFLINKFASDRT